MLLLQSDVDSRWSSGRDSLEEICAYAMTAPGKLFRPILLLESALAVGGRVADVLPAAVGTECGHVASLIHDDIIDKDVTRRGRDAVYRKFGVDNAIVAGDALIFQLFLCLAECRRTGVAADRIVSALEIVARSGVDLCRGQTLEAEITEKALRDIETYILMIRMKTGALFSGACQSGAILGGGSPESVKALGIYGDHLGIAFQIYDDLLAYVSDGTTTGKPVMSDIHNRRPTLPIILAYQTATPEDVALLDTVFAGGLDDDEALRAVTEVLGRTDAVERSADAARTHSHVARQALAELPFTQSRDILEGFTDRVVDRVR